ncbi:retrovirus-related pol polyprotein from transposon TNT 1-94 [Tanacetum coccineum]
MIHELGDPNSTPLVAESTHEQTDDELTDKEVKQMKVDDQAIQTILMGLLEDIYAAVNSCDTAKEIWLRVEQMMRGSTIEAQEKKAKLEKHFPKKIASNLKSSNNLQSEWSRSVTIVHQTNDLYQVDYTQLYDFLKLDQAKGRLQEIRMGYNALQNVRNQVGKMQFRIQNANQNGNGNVVGARAEGIDNTTKTRRPQPRSNTKNYRATSASKSSCIKNKEVEVEEHHRNLLLSKNQKHMSFACNNIKLAIRNDKSEVVCAKCCFKHMTENLKLLINVIWKFLGTARFGNDHVAVILDLEVAFRKNICFVRNLEGVNLLKVNHTTNLYTINLHEIASASPICLMARATSTKSWLWHQRLSHLNFDIINDLAKNDLNDREDIGKLGAKGDIGFFVGYSANSCAYRVYNRRTRKIMETMNVIFDELSAMDFEQRSLKPGLQGMTSRQISSGLDLTYAPS